MNDDQPPMKEAPNPKAHRQRTLAAGGGDMSGSACRCRSWPAILPLADAYAALKTPRVTAEVILNFRKTLQSHACQHDCIELEAFRRDLWTVAYQKVWGQSHSQTLPAAVTGMLSREFRVSYDSFSAVLSDLAVNFVDQAVGKLRSEEDDSDSPERVAYDPTRVGKSGGRLSLWSFVVVRTRGEAGRVFKQGVLNRSPDAEPMRREDGDRRGAGLGNGTTDPELQTERNDESERFVGVLHRAVKAAGRLLQTSRDYERRLLDLLENTVRFGKLTEFRRANHLKALLIARNGIGGVPGNCVVLDCRIGVDSDGPPLILATSVTTGLAKSRYNSPNATVLKDQVIKWIGEVIEGACKDLGGIKEAQGLAQTALALRQKAFEILDAISPNVGTLADFAGADSDDSEKPTREAFTERWRGKPRRALDDAAGGDFDINGTGIAHVPFLFGLLDPTDTAVRLLDASPDADGR